MYLVGENPLNRNRCYLLIKIDKDIVYAILKDIGYTLFFFF